MSKALKWRPIASAPMNEKVLVAALGVQNTGWMIETMTQCCMPHRFNHYRTPMCPQGEGCKIGWTMGLNTLGVPALYWMPLPNPPKQKKR